MSLRLPALQKREKLALLAVLVAAAGITTWAVWLPAAPAQAAAQVAGPASVTPSVEAGQELAARTTPDRDTPSPPVAASEAAAAATNAPEPVAPAEAAAPLAANLFPVQTWQPPPPPPPPPPKPTAPPLPFQYGGQLVEGGEIVVFLSQQKRQHVVRAGDAIDNLYRVEAIKPGRIEFTYLPLKQRQELLTGNPL